MDTSSYYFLLPALGAITLYFIINEVFHFLRKKSFPSEDLTPNQLLTSHPIILWEIEAHLFYRRPIYNGLQKFLYEHGHQVAGHRAPDLINESSHIFFTISSVEEIAKLSLNHPEKIASLNLLYHLESDEEKLDGHRFKHHINRVKLPSNPSNKPVLVLHKLACQMPFGKNIDSLSFGALQSRDYYETILRHTTDLAERDLLH